MGRKILVPTNTVMSSDPGSPATGDTWFNSALGELRVKQAAAARSLLMSGKQQDTIIALGVDTPTTPASAASLSKIDTTNGADPPVWIFPTATDEEVDIVWVPRKAWDAGTITFRVRWSHIAGTTNFGTAWGLKAYAVGNGDSLDVAFGTEVVVTDTGAATPFKKVWFSPESAALTVGNTPAKDDMVMLRLTRKTADAGDTLAEDAMVVALDIFYTTDAANDA